LLPSERAGGTVFEPASKKPAALAAAGSRKRSSYLSPIIANSLNGTALFGFLATGFLFRTLRLLGNVGITSILVALKIVRCCLATQVTINALVIDVVLARNVLRIFVCSVSHKFD
jgi:hypothetical protein